MAVAKNYFSNRTKILDIASDVGAPLVEKIQRLFTLKVGESKEKTWPGTGDDSFTMGDRGQIFLTVANNVTEDITSDTRFHDSANAEKYPIGIGMPPAGTLGYFAQDEIPMGWIELGDPHKYYPHKRLIRWIDPLLAIGEYANTEYTPVYNLLKDLNLVRSERRSELGEVPGWKFNTEDPFRGMFIRSLNRGCYGPDANSKLLDIQTAALPPHTHNGYNFPTTKYPLNYYHAHLEFPGGGFVDGVSADYNIKIYQTDDIIDGTVVKTTAHGPTIDLPSVIHWGETIEIKMGTQAGRSNLPTANRANKWFAVARYDYKGNFEILNETSEDYPFDLEMWWWYGAVACGGGLNRPAHWHTFTTWNAWKNEWDGESRNQFRFKISPREIRGDYYIIFGQEDGRVIVPLEIRSHEDSLIIDRGRSPVHIERYESGVMDPVDYHNAACGVDYPPRSISFTRRGATYPNPWEIGTKFFYNYQWRTGSDWSTLNQGSSQVSTSNLVNPPFTIKDREGRIHSIGDFDNHIHTRIKTYYRSVLDSNSLDPATDKFLKEADGISLKDSTSWFGYANTSPDMSIATEESEYAISRYQNDLGGNAGILAQLKWDDKVPPGVGQNFNPAGGLRTSQYNLNNSSLRGKIGVTYKNPFYANAMVNPAVAKYTAFYRINPDVTRGSVRATQTSHHRSTWRWPTWRSTRSSHHFNTAQEYYYNVSASGFQFFSTEVPSGAAYIPWHILKTDPDKLPSGQGFYNTGDNGNLALRTTFSGDHRHKYLTTNSHFRGEDDFRPINVALRLCIKI